MRLSWLSPSWLILLLLLGSFADVRSVKCLDCPGIPAAASPATPRPSGSSGVSTWPRRQRSRNGKALAKTSWTYRLRASDVKIPPAHG